MDQIKWSPGLERTHEEKFIEDDLNHLVDLLGIHAAPDAKAALRMTLRECYREGFKRGVEHGERLFKPEYVRE